MKLSLWLSAAAASSLLLSGCMKDLCNQKVTHWKDIPIYKTVEEIRVPVVSQSPRALKKPGKIYMFGNYVLVNEKLEGVHIIDNSNPSNPQNIAFVAIPGNIDIAMKGNVLYADNYMDLLAIDLTNPAQASTLKRLENIFPTYGTDPNDASRLLVGYDQQLVTETIPCNQTGGGPIWEDGPINTVGGGPNVTSGGSGGGAGRSGGLGGSMARFAIAGDYLYAVDEQTMHVISIVTMENPVRINQVGLSLGTETIFPYQDKLFIGSNTGMSIYSCTDPTNPQYLSRFEHAFACDPVFVEGNFAYITLRNGSPCRNGDNQLDIVDISDITNPVLVQSHTMQNPHGLAVRDNVLYLCEGTFGLKVINVTNKVNIQQLGSANLHSFDVIAVPHTDRIMVVGNDGFYQFDAANPAALEQLSKIQIQQ